jgi:hypothetical protein
MNDLDPKSWFGQLFESRGFVWLLILAIWGGTANYLNRLKNSKQPFKLVELLGEWTVSGFAGMLTAYLCIELGTSWQVMCFCAGISGHMGGRAIYLFEAKFKKLFGGKDG